MDITKAIAASAEIIARNGFTIVGAAFCLSIVIGLLREAITGKSAQ